MNMTENSRGGATLVAILVMLTVGIIVAGVLPAASGMLRTAKNSSELQEAQLAAEAGAKRMIEALYNNRTDWEWLARKQEVVVGGRANYMVIVDPPLSAGEQPQKGIHYRLTSTGTANGVQKTLQLDVTTPLASIDEAVDQTSFRFASFSGGSTSIQWATLHGSWRDRYGQWHPGGAMTNGALQVHETVNLDGSSLYATDTRNINDGTIFNEFDGWIHQSPPYELRKIEQIDGRDWQTVGGKGNYRWDLLETFVPGAYEVDGNLTVSRLTKLCLNQPGDAVLHVKGNLTVDDAAEIGTLLLPDRNILLLVDGNVSVHDGAALNHVAVVAQGNIEMRKAAIWGTMQARGATTVNGAILHYDRDVARAFVKQAEQINHKDGLTFRVGKWKFL